MGLSMKSATYGRSQVGVEALINDLNNDFSKLEDAVKSGAEIKELKETVKENWKGPDRTAFFSDVEKKQNELIKAAEAMFKQAKQAIRKDYQEFLDSQKDNYKAKN